MNDGGTESMREQLLIEYNHLGIQNMHSSLSNNASGNYSKKIDTYYRKKLNKYINISIMYNDKIRNNLYDQ